MYVTICFYDYPPRISTPEAKSADLDARFRIQTAAAQSTKPSSALTVIELYSATPET
jgi:hypothetical protein